MWVSVPCIRRGCCYQRATRGWYVCSRPGCLAIAYCPGCLGCRLVEGLLVMLCEEHAALDVSQYQSLGSLMIEREYLRDQRDLYQRMWLDWFNHE